MLLSPKGRLARLCLFLFCAATSWGLHAQATNVTPEDEYRKLIRVDEEIHPLGENLFGETVSLYNGTLSFEQTDVSLAGEGPAIQVERSFHLRALKESESIDGAFSDWDRELPWITTVTANQTNVTGWQVRNSADPDARCSHFGAPPTVMAQQGGSDWEPHSWWAGYQLVVPGQGSQDLLKCVAEDAETPQMSGMTLRTAYYPTLELAPHKQGRR